MNKTYLQHIKTHTKGIMNISKFTKSDLVLKITFNILCRCSQRERDRDRARERRRQTRLERDQFITVEGWQDIQRAEADQ